VNSLTFGILLAKIDPSSDLLLAARITKNMPSITEHLSFHAASLGLRSRRNEILASNIANAATPNFKARDISFEEEIRKQERIGPLQTSNNRHYALASISTGEETLFRQPISPSLDGNTVEMAVEQIEFSENVIRYQTSLTFLNNRISGLLSAIKGE
jgi:flagellar basal-body rod protein FlgB